MHRSLRTTAAGLAAAALVIIAPSAANAFWTTGGTGAGSVAASNSQSVSVVPDSFSSRLAPGGSPIVLGGHVANNNTADFFLTSVTVTISSVSKAADAPAGACNESDYTITAATMATNTEIRAGGSAVFHGAAISFVDKPATSQDGCKGSTINLTYIAS